MVAGEEVRVKKCVLRACLNASWKGPVEVTGRMRQKMKYCEKNKISPRTRYA